MKKKILTLMAMMAMGITMQAQFDKGFVNPYYDMRGADKLMRDNITPAETIVQMMFGSMPQGLKELFFGKE